MKHERRVSLEHDDTYYAPGDALNGEILICECRHVRVQNRDLSTDGENGTGMSFGRGPTGLMKPLCVLTLLLDEM